MGVKTSEQSEAKVSLLEEKSPKCAGYRCGTINDSFRCSNQPNRLLTEGKRDPG